MFAQRRGRVSTSVLRFTTLIVAAVGFATLYAACGGGEPTSASRELSAADGGTVSLGDYVTLKIPAGALPEDATVTITRATEDEPASGGLKGAKAVGAACDIDLGGQKLAKPATLEIRYDPGSLPENSPEDMAFLAFYDEDKKQWVPAGGKVDEERHVIIIETEHLSWWNPFSWNWGAWVAVLNKTLQGNVVDFIEAVALLTDDCPQ